MFRNLLITALRNLKREKGYTIVNILGLSIGVTCVIFLLLYLINEITYDQHHTNARNIYRIVTHAVEPDDEYQRPMVQIPLAEELTKNYSIVKNAVRFFTAGRELFQQYDRSFYEERFFYTDSTVFDMFTHKFLHGDPATALDEPFSIVLTESMATKYFDTTDALGFSITFVDRKEDYKVTGVIQDLPQNSHFHFDALMSLSSLPIFRQQTNWGRLMVSTYVQLPDGYEIGDFEPILDEIVTKHVEPLFGKRGIKVGYRLQRITDIHLYSKIQDEEEAGGDISYVYILGSIIVFILIIASINYINLVTARSARRAREVGIRKVVGSLGYQLVIQFILEATILAAASIIIAITLVVILLPAFNLLTGKQFNFSDLTNPWMVSTLVGALILLGGIGGGYPGFYLTRFSIAHVVKGRVPGQIGNTSMRKALVLLQFVLSISMLSATAVIYDQLSFMQQKDLGFKKEHVIRIAVDDGAMRELLPVFKNKILRHSTIASFATASSSPGENVRKAVVQVEDNQGKMGERGTDWFMADYDFLRTLGMTLKQGRNFSQEILSDTLQAVLVNEAMVRKMNWEEPIGKRFQAEGREPRKVIGVVADYHQNSLYNEIEPLVVLFNRNNYYSYIKLHDGDIRETIELIGKAWKEVYPDKPFEFEFLDDAFSKQYDSEERRSTIFTIFALLSILIACLGLLGLTAMTTEQRAKEISIRKINGASTSRLVFLLTRDYFWLAIIGACLALPVTWSVMEKWLINFPYRIEMVDEIPAFILAACVVLFLAICTVTFHSAKAALANPVKTLRSE